MAVAISGTTLTDAWLADLEYLQSEGEQLAFVTTISDPDPRSADPHVIEVLDKWLLKKGFDRVGTVASTIFPEAFLQGTANREQFYERYERLLPRLQKQKGNNHGTYFGRLIKYPATHDVRRGETFNQVEGIITKLQRQLRGRAPKRFTYQAQIFAPGLDDKMIMSFPCLSFVSFQLDGSRLHLTAMYRNHFYFQRALGNFVGLARLQQFVAGACGLELGSLTVHACHAQIDALGKGDTEDLIRACRLVASNYEVS